MEEKDAEKLARELKGEADEFEKKSESLKREISDVSQDWQRKRADRQESGAPPPEDEQL